MVLPNRRRPQTSQCPWTDWTRRRRFLLGHTVAVTFEDQQVYSHFVGHDAHLIRLDGTSVDDLDAWLNWMTADGLVGDGSEPGTFLGGADTVTTPELLAGGPVTEYVHVDLSPGGVRLGRGGPRPALEGTAAALHRRGVTESADCAP